MESYATNAAVGKFSAITTYMDGQLRTSAIEVGADEFSKALLLQNIHPKDVGPVATKSK